jgi:hypothetical protein
VAGEKIIWVGDGSTPSSHARAKSVINAAGTHDYFVYGGDIYTDGTTSDVTNFDNIYGQAAPSQSPAGVDERSKMIGLAVGNHEYHTVNATTLKVDNTDSWLNTHAATTIMGAPDNTKVDPNAVYSGLSSALAQQTAAAQWAHLKYIDVNGWRLLTIDAGRSGSDEGIFPTAGDYRDAVAALVNATSQRRLIVFCHFPRWSAGSSHGDRSAMGPLWQLIAPKALAMVGGHDHVYNRHQSRNTSGTVVAQQSGCVQFVCGCSGTSLNTNDAGYTPALAAGSVNFGLLRITLTDTDNVLFEYVHRGSDALQSPVTADSVTLQAAPAGGGGGGGQSNTIPYVKQQITATTSGAVLTQTLTLPNPPAVGNQLVLDHAGDKDTGNMDTWAAANGWTVKRSMPSTSVSLYRLTKISVGAADQTINPAWTLATSGSELTYMELADDATPGDDWIVVGTGVNQTDESSVNAWSSGVTDANLVGLGLGLASFGIDSIQNITSITGFSNGYTGIDVALAASGRAGLFVASKNESTEGITTDSTFTYVGTADQISGMIDVFAKAAAEPIPPDIVEGLSAPAGYFDPDLNTKAWF